MRNEKLVDRAYRIAATRAWMSERDQQYPPRVRNTLGHVRPEQGQVGTTAQGTRGRRRQARHDLRRRNRPAQVVISAQRAYRFENATGVVPKRGPP